MASPAVGLILRESYNSRHAAFAKRVVDAAGAIPVAGYLAHRDDVAVSIDPWSGRVWTPDATMAGQLAPLGRGATRVFNGTSRYLTTPDTTDLSFGNGTVDSPMSIVALVNMTDTAATRTIVSKWNGTGTVREWQLHISTADILVFNVFDESSASSAQRVSNAVIAQGAPHLFAATYDATGGATAMNGAVLYQDGAAIASTANNNATYVAMENLTAACEVGSLNAHTANFADGSLSMVAMFTGVLTAARVAAITDLCRRFYGVPA